MAYCRKCRQRIDDKAVICPYCETPQQELPVYHNSSSGQSSDGSFSSGSLVFIAIALTILGLMCLVAAPKGLVVTVPCFVVAIAAIVTVIKRKREYYKMVMDMSRAAAENDAPITKKAAEPEKMWSFADPDSVSTRPKTQTTVSKPTDSKPTESSEADASEETESTEEATSNKSTCSFDDLPKFLCDNTIKYNAELAAAGDPGIHDTIISFEIGETADEDERVQHLKEMVLEARGGKDEGCYLTITIGSGEDIYVTLTDKYDKVEESYHNLSTWKDIVYDPPTKHIGENFIITSVGYKLSAYYDCDYSDTEEKYFCLLASTDGFDWHIYADRTQFDWLFATLKEKDYLWSDMVVKAEFLESTKQRLVTLVNLEASKYSDSIRRFTRI